MTRPLAARAILPLLIAAVVARSAVFVFWPASHFDSDQAVTGLMAKHLSELRAFPVFWYGQTYMLGVEAWLAAPVIAVLGATVTALKLPLLAMNVAIAWLLYRGLTREVRLTEYEAAFATLFFVAAAPMTSAELLTANGGNVEPYLYVLLLWITRERPIWMGLVLGVGFLNREFTIYGAAALLLLDLLDRSLFTRAAVKRYGAAFGVAGLVWVAVLFLQRYSSAAGPGTSVGDLSRQLPGNNVLQLAERLCLYPRAMLSGTGRLFTVHWPELFGLVPQALPDAGIESRGSQGLAGSSWLLVPVFGIPIVSLFISRLAPIGSRLAARPPHRASVPSGADFCKYLVLLSVFSMAGYLAGRCGAIDFYTMRYELLSVLGAVGLGGWYLQAERSRALRAVWIASCAAVFAISIAAHARLLREYATDPPVALKQELIRALDARQVRYAYADFWTAYYVSFMTRERIIVASDAIMKVRTYNRVVDAHRAEAIHISRQPCAGGVQLTSAFWGCAPR